MLTCSIVIPVLDDESALHRCLAAIDGQQDRPDEVVVVDNGSADRSTAVADEHGATVLLETRPGIAAAAARGYDAATSDLILRLDADSRPPADWVRRIRRRFADDRDLGALTGPGAFTAVPSLIRRPLTGWYWRAYFGAVARRVGTVPLFGSNLAMRATAWEQVTASVHRDDPAVHDDLDLTMHLLEVGAAIAYDGRLTVPVSSRPLLHPIGLLRRALKADHTLALHEGRARGVAWSA